MKLTSGRMAPLATLVARELAHGGSRIDNVTAHAASEELCAPSYFSHPDHAGLIYGHIVLMLLAWVFILPVAIMFSLARRPRCVNVPQVCFLGVNALGLGLGAMYNAKTPDLYPNSIHSMIGWVVSWVVSVPIVVNLVSWARGTIRQGISKSSTETQAIIPYYSSSLDGGLRLSSDSDQDAEPRSDPLRSRSGSTLDGGDENNESLPMRSQYKEYGHDERDEQSEAASESIPASTGAGSPWAARVASLESWRVLGISRRLIDHLSLPLGFVVLTTGIATFGRFFEGKAIFSGLAHWIKGGVFFWLGLVTLSRWAGCFGELGWAWNVHPQLKMRKWRPSAEFVESALIFLYGSTNIFLEHPGRWGKSWSPQDLQHMAITVLFIGGGLCGMLVESTRIRDFLNTTVPHAPPGHPLSRGEHQQQQQAPATYKFSMNPIPALVIFLLGIIMSSHHQSTMISSTVHKQWGNLLTCASLARGLTWVLMYLRPPTSILPSRPPSELVASFGLIAGVIIFMASSSDTIKGMICNDLDAIVFTTTMGLVGILMAWVIVVLAIKVWAVRKEWRAEGRTYA